jgi:alpha-amylase
VLSNAQVAAYVKPDLGGGIYELDFRPKRFNLLNVLGRRAEGYHQKMVAATRRGQGGDEGVKSIHDLVAVKSAGLEDLVTYDRAPRLLFIDHFLGADTSLEALQRGRYEERGDFATGTYEIADKSTTQLTLRRRGNIYGVPAAIEKTIALRDATLSCTWRITVDKAMTETFAPELNLTLLAGDAQDRYYRVAGRELADRRLASRGETDAGAALELVNEWDKFVVRIAATPATVLWRYPLETASQSEGGFERTYQGSVITPLWRGVQLQPGKPFEARVTVELIQT